MSGDVIPRTAEKNGKLWGAKAQDWADIQEGMVRPAFLAALDRTKVEAGTRYLDVGCGAGMAAAIAANRGAEVSGIDAAEELLAVARTRSPDADFQHGDIEELPYSDNSFDVVTGFNSFQYAGNPVAALTDARRVTKTGGAVLIVTWGEPEGMEAAALIGAIKTLLPPPPPGAPGPFALSDEAMLRGFASDAGLKPLEVFDVDCPWHYPDEATALKGLASSGVSVLAINTSGEAAVMDTNAKALEAFRQDDGSYLIGATFRCLMAEA
ncbi:hypothetical protein A9Q96_01520 [Rhodobacterales bacterium 52_120_T64]|nr:hypothetical protein A9Q96_01520 [Rhodobacterales bacterium 52_120_T64]